MAGLALVALLAATFASGSDAGCYKGRPHAPVKPEDYTWNYAPVQNELQRHRLPKRFNWCSVDLGMCTPNLGQHQPIYCGACWVHGTLSMVRSSSVQPSSCLPQELGCVQVLLHLQ